jgi:hypothetical protein
MSNSLNLQLPYVEAAQAQKHVTVNEAFRRLDSVVQLAVRDRTRTTPPAAPEEGDRHIVAASATGAWAGRAQSVAAYIDGAWVFFTPRAGWFTFVLAESVIIYFTGSAWETLTPVGGFEAVGKLGVNAAADTTNRLTVRSDSVLFTADTGQATPTGNVRVVASKTASGNTASHLFQTNFSGRAEFGLTGSDDFSLKVSPNGSTWSDAFSVGAASARMDLARMPSLRGVDVFGASFASRTVVASVTVPSEIAQIQTRGYATENDGGGAVYRRVGSQPSHELSVRDAGGAWFEIVPDGGWIRARQAGAVGSGPTDDTAALQRALSSGFNVFIDRGTYTVTNAITTAAPSQQITGAGRQLTRLRVPVTFNLAAAGVIVVANDQADVSNITIDFTQTGVTSRATLIAYPPAINMNNITRVRLQRLRFTGAYDGISAVGNCGQSIFYDIECGALNVGVRLGGSVGAVQMHNVRVWPYEFVSTPPLYDIFSDGQTIGFQVGRVDDLKMFACTAFRARTIFEGTPDPANNGNLVGPFGSVVGCALDGPYSRIEMSAGELQVTSLYATSNAVDDYFIRMTGGQLTLASFDFDLSTYTAPAVQVDGGTLVMSGGTVGLNTSVSTTAFRVTSGQLLISDTRFFASPGLARTAPLIEQSGGGIVSLVGNSMAPATGSGGGVFARIGNNAAHVVVGNCAPGYTLEIVPPNANAGLYGPNVFGSGSGNVYLGGAAGGGVASGNNNTAIGNGALGSGPTTVSNATAIGNGAVVTNSNQVQLGNSATTTYVFGSVASRSDARDKADIRDTVLGLDFVQALRPVDFRWDYREDYRAPTDLPAGETWEPAAPGSKIRTRYHHGFLAQEIEALIEATGVDFGGFQDHARNGGADVKTLGYSELIAPMVRAIQELAARVETLESRD